MSDIATEHHEPAGRRRGSGVRVVIRSVGRAVAAVPPCAFALGAVAIALTTQFGLSQYPDTVPHTAYGFMAAIAVLALAAYSSGARETVAESTPGASLADADASETLPFRWEVGLVAAVFLLAAFFRFWRLLSFPPGLWFDEGVNANDAISLIERDHTRIWFNTVFGRSTLYLYLLAGSFKVFGYTLFAIRIVPAVSGLAAVMMFYFLARRLLGAVPALVATALFGVSRWAVIFSRLSWEAAIQPFLEIAAVYFFVRAIDTRSPLSFALAGAALAGGLYTYIAFRMVPIFIGLLLVYIAVTQWRAIRGNLAGLAIFAASFLIVVAPLANFALRNSDRFTERTREVSIFREVDRDDSYEPLWNNIEKSFKMLNIEGDGNGRHNLPFRPMLDEVTAALVVLGLGVSLWSLRNWRRGSLAPWLVLSLVPGALTLQIENPSGIRGIGALPPIFLLVGLAVAVVYRTMASSLPGRVAFAALACLLISGATAINYNDVFQKMRDDPRVYLSYTPEFTQVGEIVAAHADDEHVYVTRIYSGHHAVGTLAHGKTYQGYDAAYNIVFPPDGKDAFLIPDANQLQMLPTLRRLYPNLTRDDYVDPFGNVFFSRVVVPATDIAASHELPLTVIASGNARTVVPARLDREWTAVDLASGPIDVAWEGYLWATSHPGTIVFRADRANPQVRLELDGVAAPFNASGFTGALPFTVGEHRLRVSARIEQPGRIDILETRSQTTERSLADSAYGTSLGDHGFRVVYHRGREFSGDVLLQARVPFAVPVPPITDGAAIEYEADFDAPAEGTYGFALDGASSSQLLVDGQLVVDNGGGHTRRRVEATVALTPGSHRLTVQYLFANYLDLSWSMQVPGGEWRILDGQEVRVPSGAFVPPSIVTIVPDDGRWPAVMYPGFEEPRSIALAPDGGIIAANRDKLLFIAPDGRALRMVSVDAQNISDIAAAADGTILAFDSTERSLLLIGSDGNVTSRISGFVTGSGIATDGQTAYVASPGGGIVYRVALPDGAPEPLAISKGDAPVRVSQASDVTVGADGTIYVSDFEKRQILKSTDGGATGLLFRGVGGTGVQIPRLATFGNLVLVTDPTQDRILVLDSSGKQRGVYQFTPRPGGAPRPIGIAVSAAGYLYLAEQSGAIERLQLVIPPKTAAELLALP